METIPDPYTNPYQPLTLNELHTWQPKQPPEIISNGLLPKGHIMFLYGEQETWKSWLMMDLVFAIASNRPWLVYKTQPVKCLLINPEIPAPAYKSRISSFMLQRNMSIANDNLLRFWTDLDLKLDDGIGRSSLLHWCKIYEPDLVIIDGLEFVCKGDVSTGMTASALKDTINAIRQEINSAFIFVHHKKKGLHDQRTGKRIDIGIDDMYGHSLIKNMADTLLMVEKDEKNEDVINIHSMKLRMSEASKPDPYAYRFDRSKLKFDLDILAQAGI